MSLAGRTLDLDLLDYGVGLGLGAKVSSCRLPERGVIVTVLHVPDMVLPLQRQVVELDSANFVVGGMAAIEAAFKPVVDLVWLERELRPWSTCDP